MLGLGVFAPQTKIYRAYGTATFCDIIFALHINIIVNNNMILD